MYDVVCRAETSETAIYILIIIYGATDQIETQTNSEYYLIEVVTVLQFRVHAKDKSSM